LIELNLLITLFFVVEFCRFCSTTGSSEDCDDSTQFEFDEVEGEIERRTEELAGTNKGISMTPIIIQVHSPDVTDLTVVDLPGVVKVSRMSNVQL